MEIIIMGGCGFVGSNLAIDFKKKYPDYNITAFDNLQRRGAELNLQRLKNVGVIYYHGDIRNFEDLTPFDKVDIIIDASAEPSVLAGLNDTPRKLINTNLLGTINCLEFARENKARLLFLSSSRVYPIEPLNGARYEKHDTRFQWIDNQQISGINGSGISENFPLTGYRSFYGSTKLASELLINEYTKYYGLEAIINRCGVISGPWQMARIDQGFVSFWMAKHYFKGELQYNGYSGSGKQLRDILHINDLFRLVDHQFHNFNKYNGQTFNVGGGIDNTMSLFELTQYCQQITGNIIPIGIGKEREADLRIYYSNNKKIQSISKWSPNKKVIDTLQDIYDWIDNNKIILKQIFL